ncbi:MAG: reverse transcriptase domain-containing protein [Desulfobulbus sp.]|nr:reverse transcriptase domain-containing protein [Desulfobulbus sp.]
MVYVEALQDNTLSFLPQARVYASKQKMHLRRTVKLDPMAEFYIYDLVYRNRNSFRKSFSKNRENFGYRFESGKILPARESYRSFQAAITGASDEYSFGVKFDISSYFNTIYHHDLVAWFNDGSRSDEDVKGLDTFLRQTNSGRSVDCLPHGIAPCKILGSHFLKFIDNSGRLKSDMLLRFMDDFYLFSNSYEIIVEDFTLIQRLLGEKGLSVNPKKTMLGIISQVNVKREIDAMKLDLLRTRRRVLSTYDWEQEEEKKPDTQLLNDEQVDYLLDLLKNDEIEEEDAELVLTLMREHSSEVSEHLLVFLQRFPNLSKNIYYFCKHIPDKDHISTAIDTFLSNNRFVTEYQLFWLAKICEQYLLATAKVGDILIKLFDHSNATTISKTKILEIPEKRFGITELREEQLRTGKSDWLAWGAAIGTRAERKANRNHLLGYFSNGSPMNKLIADCVIGLQ